MALFKLFNGAEALDAVQLPVTTGTALETMLQIKMQAGVTFKVKAWGVSMDGAAAAESIAFELVETGVVFLTGAVAHDDASTCAFDAQALAMTTSTYFDYGTADTCYSDGTAQTEGTVTVSRVFDAQLVQPTGQYAWEFSLGNEPVISAVSALRLRVKATAAVDAIAWILIEV